MKRIIKLILIVLWMGVIFTFSSDNADKSTSKSDGVIINIYKAFHKGDISKKEKQKIIDKYVFPVRKLAHFTEYLILGVLIINFISEYKTLEIKYLLLAIILCMLYAVSDEIHQIFISGRTAKILDVFIDTLGSSTGIFLYKIVKVKLFNVKE